MQLSKFKIPLSLALWNLISIEAYPASTSPDPSASTGAFTSALHSTFAGPRVIVSPVSISSRGKPVTKNESGTELGDEDRTFREKQRRPPADTEPCSRIMGDDRQPDKLDSVIDVKSTIAFSQMNAGTTLEAQDSTTIALFSVPDPNWSRSLTSEVVTEPTSTSSIARDGTVKMPYLSSTRDDDIRYGTTLTLTPSPSNSKPMMMTTTGADSSSRPTGERTSAGGASALGLLDEISPLHPLLQWLQFAMTIVTLASSINTFWVLSYKWPNREPPDDVKLSGDTAEKGPLRSLA